MSAQDLKPQLSYTVRAIQGSRLPSKKCPATQGEERTVRDPPTPIYPKPKLRSQLKRPPTSPEFPHNLSSPKPPSRPRPHPKTTVIRRRFPSPTIILNRSETHTPIKSTTQTPTKYHVPNTPKPRSPISAPLFHSNDQVCVNIQCEHTWKGVVTGGRGRGRKPSSIFSKPVHTSGAEKKGPGRNRSLFSRRHEGRGAGAATQGRGATESQRARLADAPLARSEL